jgi:hypothetical protein
MSLIMNVVRATCASGASRLLVPLSNSSLSSSLRSSLRVSEIQIRSFEKLNHRAAVPGQIKTSFYSTNSIVVKRSMSTNSNVSSTDLKIIRCGIYLKVGNDTFYTPNINDIYVKKRWFYWNYPYKLIINYKETQNNDDDDDFPLFLPVGNVVIPFFSTSLSLGTVNYTYKFETVTDAIDHANEIRKKLGRNLLPSSIALNKK